MTRIRLNEDLNLGKIDKEIVCIKTGQLVLGRGRDAVTIYRRKSGVE